MKCWHCNREYTKQMMLQVNEYAKRYLCIKCYNEKETNEKIVLDNGLCIDK